MASDQFCDDIGLQIREGQDQVRLEREDLRHIGRNECGHARLLAAHLRWPYGIARHTDNAAVFTEEIKGFDGLFGQANDSLRREHALGNHISLCRVEQFDAALATAVPPSSRTTWWRCV